jgi:hypothetical protein
MKNPQNILEEAFIKSVFSLFLSFSLSFLSLTNGIVSSGGAPVA